MSVAVCAVIKVLKDRGVDPSIILEAVDTLIGVQSAEEAALRQQEAHFQMCEALTFDAMRKGWVGEA